MHNIEIKTNRLLLRPLTVTDADSVFIWGSDERVTRYMNYQTYTKIEPVREWLASLEKEANTYSFGFERLSDGTLIGSGDIRVDQNNCWSFGYNLRYDCWGKGYATEATRAMIDYAHENLGAADFSASHAEPNHASGKVIKKCGLKFIRYGIWQKLDGSCKMRSMEYEMTL